MDRCPKDEPTGKNLVCKKAPGEKRITWYIIWLLVHQTSEKSFHTFEDIEVRESHTKLHKKRSETLGTDSI